MLQGEDFMKDEREFLTRQLILKKKCIIYYVARNSVQYAGVAELADAHV